ncbi:MAG TPA: hypothetical protein PKD55_00410 [Bellilinea sp.]|nr:hypothetical protein [Bellilinea sp.]
MTSVWDTSADAVDNLQPGAEFDRPDAGTYKVLGIKGYVWKDDAGNPIFKPSALDGDMQALVRLKVEGEYPDILASLTVAQLVVLVGSLGANPELLKPIEATAGFLLRVEEVLSKIRSPKKIEARVTDRSTPYVAYWGNDFAPPLGEYTMRIAKMYALDGKEPITFQPAYEGKAYIIKILFEIVGDMWGNPTPYAGFRISEPFYDPFADTEVGEDGIERPSFQTFEDGKEGTPVNVVRFNRLLSYFARSAPGGVSWGEYRWESDPTRSQFGINELSNPIEVVRQRVMEESRQARGALSRTRNGRMKVDLLSFQFTEDEAEDIPFDVDSDKGSQSAELQKLVIFIEDKMTPDTAVFKPTPEGSADLNLELTPEGVEWAKSNLVELWDSMKLTTVHGQRQFAALNPAECDALYEVLKGMYEEKNLAF